MKTFRTRVSVPSNGREKNEEEKESSANEVWLGNEKYSTNFYRFLNFARLDDWVVFLGAPAARALFTWLKFVDEIARDFFLGEGSLVRGTASSGVEETLDKAC